MLPTDIHSYIPQRAPFIMVDEILSAEGLVSRTSFTIKDNNIFLRRGYFTEPGLVENIAQAAGAGVGYRNIAAGLKTPLGYIAAIKNLVIIRLPQAGDTIITDTILTNSIRNLHVVTGTVFLNDVAIASCEFKIFLHPEP